MGIFGPSLAEKIRRSATATLPQATWKVEIDWSTGQKLHRLQGSMSEQHTDADTMQYARNVWSAVVKDFRLAPDDARDGLLDVSLSSAGGAAQCSGVAG